MEPCRRNIAEGNMSANSKRSIDGPFSCLPRLLDAAGLKLKNGDKAASGSIQKTSAPAPPTVDCRQPVDNELFAAAMQDVKRMDWPHAPHPSPPPEAILANHRDADDRKMMQDAIDGGAPFPIPDHPEYIEGWIGAAGKRLLPNLRNGLYSIQGQIDLHGFNRVEAQIAVEDYIVRMSRYRSCCVKIIHGRGINSASNRATIKESLQRLLATRRMARYVVAYASAQSCDGGVGAVYVLLRHA